MVYNQRSTAQRPDMSQGIGEGLVEDQRQRSLIEDVGIGIAGGVVSSVQSAWNLADTILGDSLKDWDDPIISKPETMLGTLAGGFAQFLFPYIGMTRLALPGIASAAKYFQGAAKSEKFSRSLKLIEKHADWLAGNTSSKAIKELQMARNAGDSIGFAAGAKALASFGARESIRGGFVDFVAFEGMDARFSDLVQQFPGLQNPITEYLSSDEDDSVVEGRFKNVIEGFALGGITDSILAAARGMRVYSKSIKAGIDEEGARVAALAAATEAAESRSVLRNELERKEADEALDETFTWHDKDGVAHEATNREVRDEIRAKVKKDLDGIAKGELPPEADFPSVTPEDGETLEGVARTLGDLRGSEILQDNANNNPRVAADRLEFQTGDEVNLSKIAQSPFGFAEVQRAVDEWVGTNWKKSIGNEGQILRRGIKAASDLTGVGESALQEAIKNLGEAPEEILKFANQMVAYQIFGRAIVDEILPNINALSRGENLSVGEFAKTTAQFKTWLKIQRAVNGIASAFGVGLRARGMMIPDDAIEQIAKNGEAFTFMDVAVEIVENDFDPVKAKNLMAQMAALLKSEDPMENAKAMTELLEAPLLVKSLEVAQEFQINALLSGPATQIVNFMSGFSMANFRPFEKMLGAGIDQIGASLVGDATRAAEAAAVRKSAARELTNLYSDIGEFWDIWKASRQAGVSPFDSKGKIEGPDRSRIAALAIGKRSEGFFSGLARVVNFPSTVMGQADAGMKIWTGRAKAREVLYRKHMEMGTPPEQIAGRVNEALNFLLKQRGHIKQQARMVQEMRAKGVDQLDNTVARTQLAPYRKFQTDEEIEALIEAQEAGFRAGKEVTFTTELDADFGNISKYALLLQAASARNPVFRMFVPFVRTPANIAEYTWDRTIGPLLGVTAESFRRIGQTGSTAMGIKMGGLKTEATEKGLLRWQKALLSTDPEVRAQAKANLAISVGSIGTAMAAIHALNSAEDNAQLPGITGKGPTNPDARATLEAAGWQPYSIKINGKYYSYQRLDPFASIFLGTAVDLAEYVQETHDEDSSLVKSASMGMMVALANNITNKTYMQGLTTLLEVITNPGKNFERGLGATVASFVPSALANVESINDPVLSEIRGITDRIYSRIPGLSGRLDPRRNILGKPIKRENALQETFLPIRVSAVEDKQIEKELARFAYGFSMPGTARGGVDLLDEGFVRDNQTAYDRMLELSGEVKIGRKDLRQALKKTINSREYQKLDPVEGPDGQKSERINVINGVLRQYRKKAWETLLKERPEIRAEFEAAQQTKARRKRGLTIL